MDRLANTVRPYAWGSATAIPALLGVPATGQPQAELWMGAHPGAPSLVDRGSGPVSLADVIGADPRGELGDAVVDRFGPTLPFLFKVLAAGSPLSLQVHPDLDQARQGFADEEERGVPLDAPNRNYKDANHKPELICALEPFEGLCGFRPAAESAALFEALGIDPLKPYVDILRAKPESGALREVLTAVLSAEPDSMAETVGQAAAAAERLARTAEPFAASCAAYASLARHFPGDPGVIAAMLLNHVVLQPGEALYLGAGVPHAYLSGLGVEIMANSDNVLRCGLTPKHVDVPELLRVVDFRSTDPGVLRPSDAPVPQGDAMRELVPGERAAGEMVYGTPIDEFRLSRRVLAGSESWQLPEAGPQILLCTGGSVLLRDQNGRELRLSQGESAYLAAGSGAEATGDGTLFRATVAI